MIKDRLLTKLKKTSRADNIFGMYSIYFNSNKINIMHIEIHSFLSSASSSSYYYYLF